MRRVRLDLAWRDLNRIPPETSSPVPDDGSSVTSTTDSSIGSVIVVELDLSHNEFTDASEITLQFPRLETLVLDCNRLHSHSSFSRCESLRTLSVNSNSIENLPAFVGTVAACFPHLAHLSLLRNAACPNYFVAGGSPAAYADYRLFVISRIPSLVSLDGSQVSDEERAEAKRLYGSLPTIVPAATAAARSHNHSRGKHLKTHQRKVQAEEPKPKPKDPDDWTDDEDDQKR